MESKAQPSGSRHSETPFFHVGQRLERSGATRVDLRRWAYVGLAIALLGLVGWLYLEQASEVASYGYEIRQLENHKERLRRELTALGAEVAVQGSAQRILAAGERLGYVMPAAEDATRRLVIEYRLPPTPPAGPLTDEAGGASGTGAMGTLRGVLRDLGGASDAPTDGPR